MDERATEADWKDWLKEHGPKFWLFARQKALSDGDAEDLMQEAIIESANRSSHGKTPDPALVFATIRRRAIDLARSAKRRAVRETIAAGTAQPWFDVGAEERERAKLLQESLAKLPERYREVVTLKVWGELTFAQIAVALEIPLNTAASRYRNGLEELRKLTKEVFT